MVAEKFQKEKCQLPFTRVYYYFCIRK